ncbi:unnamed protein product [Prorocentrum cordatum]|uniref:Uncharacterized protein n=1 Tax=Prorocentrum cordatum TaxID=2364126 RepID=A0ABN9S4Q1_9DINO|nr:unnamed protein product [Polarella glacialis]
MAPSSLAAVPASTLTLALSGGFPSGARKNHCFDPCTIASHVSSCSWYGSPSPVWPRLTTGKRLIFSSKGGVSISPSANSSWTKASFRDVVKTSDSRPDRTGRDARNSLPDTFVTPCHPPCCATVAEPAQWEGGALEGALPVLRAPAQHLPALRRALDHCTALLPRNSLANRPTAPGARASSRSSSQPGSARVRPCRDRRPQGLQHGDPGAHGRPAPTRGLVRAPPAPPPEGARCRAELA